jgi:hypothetical protein
MSFHSNRLVTAMRATFLGSVRRLSFTAILLLGACVRPADHASDMSELMRLHNEQRTAHVERRAGLLVAGQADTLLSVSNGRVSKTTRERAVASFQAYFNQSTFQAWDDITPPRIQISPDGNMAYVIVEKRVHVTTTPPSGGTPTIERVRYAWLSVYEKRDGVWRMTVIASTDRPDST